MKTLLNVYTLFAQALVIQLIFFAAATVVYFFFFETLPLFFGFRKDIKKNIPDLLRFHIVRSIVLIAFGIALSMAFIFLGADVGLFDIRNFPLVPQVAVIYLSAEFFIYLCHVLAHAYAVPLLSKAHAFHHTVSSDMEWTNSKKEHYFVLCLFVFVFVVFFFVVFHTSGEARMVAGGLYIFLTSFSHLGIPISVKYFDQFFLFPKDHLRHHTRKRGPIRYHALAI